MGCFETNTSYPRNLSHQAGVFVELVQFGVHRCSLGCKGNPANLFHVGLAQPQYFNIYTVLQLFLQDGFEEKKIGGLKNHQRFLLV